MYYITFSAAFQQKVKIKKEKTLEIINSGQQKDLKALRMLQEKVGFVALRIVGDCGPPVQITATVAALKVEKNTINIVVLELMIWTTKPTQKNVAKLLKENGKVGNVALQTEQEWQWIMN